MAGKVRKIILRTLVGIIIFVAVLAAAAYMFVKLYVIPKYNSSLDENAAQSEKLTEKDVINIAKNLADVQVIENIVKMDKESAKDLLQVAKEVEKEIGQEPEAKAAPTPKAKVPEKTSWNKRITSRVEAVPTPTPTPSPQKTPESKTSKAKTSENKSVPKKNEVEGATAYERIMNAATKEEISAGTAILAKVDMGKVNSLRSQGKTSELKKYITSVLSGSEIRKALSLYSKYKHLL